MNISNINTDQHLQTLSASSTRQVNTSPSEQQEIFKIEKTTSQAANITSNQVTFSHPSFPGEVNSVLLNQQEVAKTDDKEPAFLMNTNKGYIDLNLNKYFANTDHKIRNLSDATLLMPSAENIAALSDHTSTHFKQLLNDYNIPYAPETITYNSEGKMQLPHDYPHANDLKQALDENPGMKRELSTLHALSSQYAELQKILAFHEEYSEAETSTDIQAVIDKYSHLLWGNRQNSNITLTFTENSKIDILIDGKPLKG